MSEERVAPPVGPMFVVLEGLDGAGTTTQARLLNDRLQSLEQPSILTCEPSNGPIGALIRQMLAMRVVQPTPDGGVAPVRREALALLFAADRLDHVSAVIEPALNAGSVVISDRYYHSSLVYQGDVDGEDKVDYGWVRTLNERARVPDLTIFLEAPVELCLSRLEQRGRRDIYETREKMTRLERRYDEVMTMLAEDGQPILRLDASRSISELSERIVTAVQEAGQNRSVLRK